jgi:hypothetical protein
MSPTKKMSFVVDVTQAKQIRAAKQKQHTRRAENDNADQFWS